MAEALCEPSERDPIIETILDLIASAILLAGMFFYVLEVNSHFLKTTWLLLSVVAAAYIGFSSLKSRSDEMPSAESGSNRNGFRFADMGTLLFSVPALLLNLAFALG